MKSRVFQGLVFAGTAIFWSSATSAAPGSGGATLPNLDQRAAQISGGASTSQEAATEHLRGLVPQAQVDFDLVTGSPKMVMSREGFLSGVNGLGQGITTASAAAVAADDPNRATRAFLTEHSKLFGYGPEALDAARIARDYTTPHNGLKTVVWEQQVGGIPVFEGTLISHTTAQGELVSVCSQFVKDPASAADLGTPNRAAVITAPAISASQGVALAARNVGEGLSNKDLAASGEAVAGPEQRQKFTGPALQGEAEVKLIWLPMDSQTMRLCWDVVLTSRSRDQMFRSLVDARTGEVLVRRCLTSYISNASYRVFTSDSPSPFSPGNATPVNNQPPLVARTLVTLPALDTNASPAGWIDDGGNETRGNNVDAHTDLNADNAPDLPRPQGSPFRVFDFAMDLTTQDPTNYSSASVVQLFYLCNWYHDRLYQLGFTEGAGNFQSNNFGRGGIGGDAVQADALDGSGLNNANFSTPPDGSAGRMQMYIFTGPSPRRDGSLDAEIVLHEATHGLSWRLVGGGQALGDTQSDGMGEGWSDFYALTLLSEAGDDVNGNYAAGAYGSYKIGGATDLQNYYFGIRRYPYTTALSRNPLTFNDIDPAQADFCSSGAPYHTGMFGACSAANASEVHNEGELWCVTLWEARANLINKYGWATGNQLILQLVTDGMKLTPMHPNFLQARDAILQADLVDTGGSNQTELWAGFAKRGMGYSASSPASSTTTGVHQSFDLPDNLRILPTGDFSSQGPVGGPFTPVCKTYAVTNAGATPLSWVAWSTQPWVSVSSAGGTLGVGGSSNIDVCITAAANALAAGAYNAAIFFSNVVSGAAPSRGVSLSIPPPNDLCVSATTVSVTPFTTNQSTLGATSTGDPVPSCIGSAANGVWFKFTAPADGQMVVDTISSGFDTVLTTYTGVCGSLTQIGCDDDSGGNLTSRITNAVTSGTTYYILAGGYFGSQGSLVFHLNFTSFTGPPSITAQPPNQTVPAGGSATFCVTAIGSSPLSYFWRRNGSSIAGATTSCYTTNNVQLADSGAQFSCLVSNALGTNLSANALLTVVTAPANDQCAGAATVAATPFATNESTLTATSTGDPIPSCVGSAANGVWFKFTAPSDGQMVVDTISSGFDTVLATYTGTCGSLTAIGCNDDGGGNLTSLLTNTLTSGTTCYILAGGFAGSVGNMVFHLNFIASITSNSPPLITAQPQNQLAIVGGSATFCVTATGSTPLGYFWRRNGSPIPGATGSCYTTNNVQLTDSGAQFSCLVSNVVGTTNSAAATLTVASPFAGISFDDLPGTALPVPNGYRGFTWSNFVYIDAFDRVNDGYHAGMISVSNVAFNSLGTNAFFAGTSPFNLQSAFLTAAWNDNLQLVALGRNGPSLLYSNAWILSATAPTLINFAFAGVTEVDFISSGGTPHPGYGGAGTQFAMDNVTVTTGTSLATTNAWNGSDFLASFGEPNTATYGQTFIAPPAAVLTSFTLYLSNITASADFRFYVMAWDGTKATGPILYQSAPATTLSQVGWHPYTFNVGNLALTPGASYVAFISASTLFDGTNNAAAIGLTPGTAYTNGIFVYHNNGADFSLLTNMVWGSWLFQRDMAFVATFNQGVSHSALPPGSLRLSPPTVLADGTFEIWAMRVDGQMLNAEQAEKVQFYSSTDVTLASTNWKPLTNGITVVNGMFRVGGLTTESTPVQFFRAVMAP